MQVMRGFDPWVGKIPWRRKWYPIPIFLPGKSHGQRRLVGYSPWGHKESDTTEQLNNVPIYIYIYTYTYTYIYTRILEWVAIVFSRWSCLPRDQAQVSSIGRFLTWWILSHQGSIKLCVFMCVCVYLCVYVTGRYLEVYLGWVIYS